MVGGCGGGIPAAPALAPEPLLGSLSPSTFATLSSSLLLRRPLPVLLVVSSHPNGAFLHRHRTPTAPLQPPGCGARAPQWTTTTSIRRRSLKYGGRAGRALQSAAPAASSGPPGPASVSLMVEAASLTPTLVLTPVGHLPRGTPGILIPAAPTASTGPARGSGPMGPAGTKPQQGSPEPEALAPALGTLAAAGPGKDGATGIRDFPLNPVISPVEHPRLPRFWRGRGGRGIVQLSLGSCLRAGPVLSSLAHRPPRSLHLYHNHQAFLARLVS